jgi:hypothetical protein
MVRKLELGRFAVLGVALVAMACGDDGGSPETSSGNGGSGASPSASAGAPSMPSGGAGGGTSGSNAGSEGQNVSGGVSANGGSPGGGTQPAGNAGSSNLPGACTASECAGVDVNGDGMLEPGCCTMAGACGGEIENAGTTFCAPAGGGAFPFEPETIVEDARCEPQTLGNPQMGGAGITLPGCCDPSGICGVSTAGAAGDAGAGIPIACLTPADLAAFGMGADAGAFPEVSCQ